MCLYLCVHVNPLGRIHNEQQDRSSTRVCQHWTVCVFESFIVCAQAKWQHILLADVLFHFVCVLVCVCECQRGSDPLTWQLFLRECTHPCHYCSAHCWLTAFSTAQEMSVSQSVTLLISSQSQHTWVVLTVPTGHWWYMKSVLLTKLLTYLCYQDFQLCHGVCTSRKSQ